ncbi:hypothetical protein D1007_58412 [Hordeum vulgare]|nr:hypothetical protein D1007_58412 [Hordeum vulgare]
MAFYGVFAGLLRAYKLDGTNYMVWKRKIMFLLTDENIDYVSEAGAPNEPTEDATDEEKQEYADELKQWTKDNKTARVYILGSMADSLAAEYESDKTACGIMVRLEQDFGEVSLVKVLSLVNKFMTSKMGDKTVNEHFSKLCVLAEELKTAVTRSRRKSKSWLF